MHLEHLRGVDLNLLVALDQLFETGSVTQAAGRLGLSQPAMSRTLGRLRATLADPLFIRTAQGLSPTPRAQALRPQLSQLLHMAEGLVAPPERFDAQTAQRTFTISTSDYGQAVMLPALVDVVARQAPNISLRLLISTDAAEQQLQTGAWDLLWSPQRQGPVGAGMVWQKLFDEHFAFVLHRDHRLARGRMTLERFLSVPQLAMAPSGRPGNPLDDRLERLGKRRRVVAHVSSFLAAPSLLVNSELGAVLPRRLAEKVADFYQLKLFDLPFELPGFDLSQAWHERMRHDAGHMWLRSLVRSMLGRREPTSPR